MMLSTTSHEMDDKEALCRHVGRETIIKNHEPCTVQYEDTRKSKRMVHQSWEKVDLCLCG